MDAMGNYIRKLQLLSNTISGIEELEQKRRLLIDELHRVDSQLSKHRAFMLKLEVELDEIIPDKN